MNCTRYHLFSAGNPTSYEGLDRSPPQWRSQEPAASEWNRLCNVIAEQGEGFDDVDAAMEVSRRLTNLGEEVEVIADVPEGCEPPQGSVLLGFDVTYFSYHTVFGHDGWLSERDAGSPREMIVFLLGDYFRERLTPSRLFANQIDAERCRRCLLALKQVWPDLFEDDRGFVPAVHPLYRVEKDKDTRHEERAAR